jgi:hypothetical protein
MKAIEAATCVDAWMQACEFLLGAHMADGTKCQISTT